MVASALTTLSIKSCSKDPIGYQDGYGLYAYYGVQELDPLGTTVIKTRFVWNLQQSGQAGNPQFPFPKIPPGVCAGTDCSEDAGITTEHNHTDPHPDCGKYCKHLLVSTHEGEHRKNMGSCCEKRNKCLNMPLPPGIDPVRWRTNCQKAWNTWKLGNALDLEQRAAVETCKLAKEFKKNCKSACGGPGDTWWDCCEIAKTEERLVCGATDANAPIECCPFKDDGMIDGPCFQKNVQKLQQQGNPYPTLPTR